jgi:hypothetical protein
VSCINNIKISNKYLQQHYSNINLSQDYGKIQIGTYDNLTTTIKFQSYFMDEIVNYIKKEMN